MLLFSLLLDLIFVETVVTQPAPLQVAFSTLACPTWNWHDVVAHGSQYGFEGVEIRQLSGETNLLKVPELDRAYWLDRRHELDAARFRVAGLASSIRFDHDDPAQIDEQLEIGRAYLDLGMALGAEFIRVFGDLLPTEPAAREKKIAQIAEGLSLLGDLASDSGIQILLETHGDFSASAPCVELMSRISHPNVGLVWDTHHPWRFFGESLEETWDAIGSWVRHTHWKDSILLPERQLTEAQQAAAESAGMLMAGHRHADYVLFRGGEFPAAECLKILLESQYSGWHSLEWEKMWHPELLDPQVALPLFPIKLRELATHIS